MLSFEKIVGELGALGVNLYDFSLFAPDGTIRTHRFQPCNRCNDSYSVAKAFTMTAVGLLWDDGLLDTDDLLYEIFGRDFPENADPAWRLATVGHALTHRLGFDASQLDIDVDDVSAYPTDDYLRLALTIGNTEARPTPSKMPREISSKFIARAMAQRKSALS